jgi:hypothetical protein
MDIASLTASSSRLSCSIVPTGMNSNFQPPTIPQSQFMILHEWYLHETARYDRRIWPALVHQVLTIVPKTQEVTGQKFVSFQEGMDSSPCHMFCPSIILYELLFQ